MEYRPINFLEQQTEIIKPKKPRWLIFLIIIILLFLGGCLAKNIISEKAPNDPEAYDPITLKPKKPEGFFQKMKYLVFNQDKELIGQDKDRINILLLGMGGVGHDGPFLTDTNIIVGLKPSNGQIAMISIPRDLGVAVPKQGIKKINYINSLGETKETGTGGEFARKIFSETFDLNIPYYIRVDFKAFGEIIEAVGGVTIDVENDFTDHMYPAPNNDYQTVSFVKGVQTMDGNTALKYARSRHGSGTEGSDFARARRQQKILLALKEKMLSFSTLSNPLKINNIIKSLENHITTNLEFSDIISFIKLARELNFNQITNLVFDDSETGYLKSTFGVDGAFLLIPKTGNFTEINNTISNVFSGELTAKETKTDDTPKQTLKNENIIDKIITVEIQNGTWNAGLAARLKKRLEDKGFTIELIGNSETRPQPYSGIFNLTNKKTEIENSLSQELHLPIKQQPPTNINAATGTDILILLGEDNIE
ncbi:MAG: hypothetical protein US42_C0014G0059 [Candidatus Magasanikbacteria bacterium GW2011_GWC2_37_14]|uniref:Cell envelope-related transcriptional attenuator n=1 Tax=Candidatus Magasanikbacteria bacterium GW2011_GWC2_37_14 TaxID=1619046 RepID=A0A0G0GB41_9BACT|nr:MAG: hypothetical protein US42_C0014G0059 [Candidatus Magasanikbacteria bacterium GW2011_GWC2_37_14]